MLKKCIICDSEFETKSGTAKFCSAKCRDAKIPVDKHIGEIHGELEIRSMYRKQSCLYANCICSCGKECTVRYCHLLAGHTRTCGHSHANGRKIEGKTNKYGVRALHKTGKKGNKTLVHCICSCGNEFDTDIDTFSKVQSCGCVRKSSHQEGTDVYNLVNVKLQKNNTSGIRGVTWNKESQKWVAFISFKRNYYYLGKYEELTDAAEARRAAEENIYGNFLFWYARKYPQQWEIINNRQSGSSTAS